jgi:FMN phosphatase YigB (HAD superfamily)
MSIRAITFDYWGTLFRDENSEPRQAIRIKAFAKAAHVSEDAAAVALDKVWGVFARSHREDKRTLFPHDAVQIAARELGIEFEPGVTAQLAAVFATAILAHSPAPIEGALDAVRAAAARVPVGLISDTGVSPGSSLRVLMDRHGFTQWFSALTFSDEMDGIAKPQAVMFEITARQLGVEVDELLHIGDLSHTDIAGAQAVGAKAALFTGVNNEHIELCAPDYLFTSWDKFVEALPWIIELN